MVKSKQVALAGSLFLVAVWSVWCILFLRRGLDLSDEGLYCTEAWRVASGDLLFRDTMASSGLTPWYQSIVFHLYPDCGLLGLRVIWAVVMLFCALAAAELTRRHFNPAVSYAGATAGLLFATGGAHKVLSYNSMYVPCLILFTWLWLAALRRSGSSQILLAGGAGIMAFLATTCRLTLVVVVLLPILTLVYDRCCGVKGNGWLRPAIALYVAYAGGLVFLVVGLAAFGLIGDLCRGVMEVGGAGHHSVSHMVLAAAGSTFFYLLGALIAGIGMLLLKWRSVLDFAMRNKGLAAWVVPPVLILCVLGGLFAGLLLTKADFREALVNWAFRIRFGQTDCGYWVPMSLALGIVVVAVISHVLDLRSRGGDGVMHDRYRLAVLAVSVPFLAILGTNTFPAEPPYNASFLAISVAAGLSWVWIERRAAAPIRGRVHWILRVGFVALLLLFSSYGVAASRSTVRDGPLEKHNTMPSTARLRGILTREDLSSTVDRLVAAVQRYSEPGDRILAYEYMCMLPFLTERLPATNTVWLVPGGEDPAIAGVAAGMDRSVRQAILDDMIERGRSPQVVVRTTYLAVRNEWPTVRYPLPWDDNQQETDPIDRYVLDHYVTVEDVDGIQVMVPVTGDLSAGGCAAVTGNP